MERQEDGKPILFNDCKTAGMMTVEGETGAISSKMTSANKGNFFTCSGKVAHLKVMAFCLLCMCVYVYLYSEVGAQTSKIQEIVNGTLQDLRQWRHAVQGWMASLRQGNRYGIGIEVTSNIVDLNKYSTTPKTIENHSHTRNNTQRNKKVDASKNNSDVGSKSPYKASGSENDIPLLTLFTTWPTKADKFICHNNTITNWISLKPYVQSILFTNEADLADRARKKGWRVLPLTKTGKGIPILKYMFLDAMNNSNSHFYGYSNGDILFTDNLLKTLRAVIQSSIPKSTPMMIIGQRTNAKDVTEQEATTWNKIASVAKSRGQLFTTYAEDYFITMKNYPWKEIPELVIGRRAYDNWLLLNARKRGFTTFDITKTSLSLHQTTKAGNYEGHQHKDGDYNHNLLVKLYRRINYGAGLTSCAGHVTKFDKNGAVIIEKRKVARSCYPV